jgi:hypothetical protein
VVDVVRVQSHEAVHDHDIPLHGAVEPTVVEQPLDPGDPTSAPGHVAAEQQMEREPANCSRSSIAKGDSSSAAWKSA